MDSNDKLVVYSKEKCKYCSKSKALLSSNNIPFTEIKLNPEDDDYEKEITNLKSRAKDHKTFPFIFIGPDFLGGFTELNHSLNTNLSERLKKIGIEFKPDLNF